MARGGNALDIMMYDAFFLRKNLVCATYLADCSQDNEILIILDSISKGAAEGHCLTVQPAMMQDCYFAARTKFLYEKAL